MTGIPERLARLATAYLIASVGAGFVPVFWERLPVHGFKLGAFDFDSMFERVEFFSVGFSALAIAPSLVLIVIAETKRVDAWQVYSLAGALVGAAIFATTYWAMLDGPTMPPPISFLPGACLAGGLAGTVYKMIAGRGEA